MKLKIIDGEFSVCKVQKYTHEMFSHDFVFTGKTDEEKSVLLPTEQFVLYLAIHRHFPICLQPVLKYVVYLLTAPV